MTDEQGYIKIGQIVRGAAERRGVDIPEALDAMTDAELGRAATDAIVVMGSTIADALLDLARLASEHVEEADDE